MRPSSRESWTEVVEASTIAGAATPCSGTSTAITRSAVRRQKFVKNRFGSSELPAHQQIEDDAELDHEIGRGEQEREGWDERRALLE
jgi:hypothetical protein